MDDPLLEDKILSELDRIFIELTENQVEMDDDFARVLYDNLWELYE